MTAFGLLAIGFLLIFLEFYLPGAVIGISGGILVATSIFIFASESTAIWAVLLYILFILIVLVYLVRFALWKIRTAKPEYSIYSNKDQKGYVASQYDKSAIGKRGIVLSDLKPGGYILIDGIQHQAISEGGYVTRNSTVEVVSGQEESLIVKLVATEEG